MAGFNYPNNQINNPINNGWNNRPNNTFNNSYNNYGTNTGYMQSNTMGLTQQQIIQFFEQGKLVWTDYVQGRTGAEAYQLPPGITVARLLDNDQDRFYVKGYDDNGRPRILFDNDFQPHIDPEPQPYPQVDLSNYATKDDLRAMINEAFSNIEFKPNLKGYVTQEDLNQALSGLAVGNGGRIVRYNESNA